MAIVFQHAVFVTLQFFTGESMNPEGLVGLLDYREDNITPYMLFFKDGLQVEKCVSTQLSLQKHASVMKQADSFTAVEKRKLF